MKNIYSLFAKNLPSLKKTSESRDSWRNRGAKLFVGALILATATSASAQVSLGTGTTTSGNVPITSNYGYTYSQQIYLKSEINAAGEITSISFMPSNTTQPSNWVNSKDWVVYLGHTTQTSFSTNEEWVPFSALTQVFAGEVTYPAIGGPVTLTFTTPFVYNNIDNLVVAVDENTAAYGGLVNWRATNYGTGSNRSMMYRSDTVNPDPANPPLVGQRYNDAADVVLGNILQSCPQPVNFTMLPTKTSVSISWTGLGTASTGYEYEIRTSGAAGSGATGLVSSGTTAANVLTATILNLTTTTNYTAHVRSICGSTESSGWTNSSFFTDYCLPVSTNANTYFNNVSTTGGTLTNISNLASGYSVGGYQDNYNTQSITTLPTSAVDLNYTIVGGTAGVAAWIDFNNDLIFSPSEKIFNGDGYEANGDHTITFMVPAGIAPGDYRMRIKVDYNNSTPNSCTGNRAETEDYKVTIVAQPTIAVDNASIVEFKSGLTPATVTSIQSCQDVEVSALATKAGLTDAAGQATTITAWIGKFATDTDPATWPESAWTLAVYSADQANGDLYTATFTGLTVGDNYFASRFKIGTGVYAFGGQNGIWNSTTNTNALLAVTAVPTIAATSSMEAVCSLTPVELTATSTNANFTYQWNLGGGSGATTTVTPSQTTTYTVTGTDSITGCTSTATVTVVINPTPAAFTIAQENTAICANTVVELTASESVAAAQGQIGQESFVTTAYQYPNPFSTHYGGVKNQMVYTIAELQAIGMVAGTTITSVGFDIAAATGSKVCNDFTIKIGKTTETTLTAFVNTQTLAPVYNQTYIVTAAGPVSFTLTTPYVWDGTTNLVVETTHNGGNGGSGATTYVKYSNTATPLAFYGASDYITPATVAQFDQLTSWSSTGSSVNRPNTSFGFALASPIVWTPIEGLFTDQAATVPYLTDTNLQTVYAKPTATTTYVATANTETCSVSDSVMITVNAAPDAPTGDSPQAAATIADLVVTPTTLVWWYASEADALSGENPLENSTVLVDGATYYAVQINAQECRSAILAVVIDASLSNQSNVFASLKYFPNPVNDVLNISFSENITAYTVFNLIGQQVLSAKVNANSTSVDMSTLQSGSYLMQIETANASKVIKLIKK